MADLDVVTGVVTQNVAVLGGAWRGFRVRAVA
jgi:hypothetical protein